MFNVGDRVRYSGSFFKKQLDRKVGIIHSRVNDKNVVVGFPTSRKGTDGTVEEKTESFVMGEVLLVAADPIA